MRGFQRTYLRGLAHELKPVVLVGQHGITPELIAAVDRALLDHELIKVRLNKPDDKHTMAAELSLKTSAHLCGLIGHMVILYRPHPEEPTIRLPTRKK